jgi:hypothetical protein
MALHRKERMAGEFRYCYGKVQTMKLRTFKEEDSFHKREIVEEISTWLNQKPIINADDYVVWIFSEQKIGILMHLNPELVCPLFNPPDNYDYGWAWMLEFFISGVLCDRCRVDDTKFTIPLELKHETSFAGETVTFSGESVTFKNYLKAFIDVAKIRLGERDIAETKENNNERDS